MRLLAVIRGEPATGGRYCEAHHEILTTQGDIDAE
jgi:hypothetical protein